MATQTSTNSEKEKALKMVLTQIERSFGKGSIVRLGDATRMKVETIPSGALTLDLALGGGLPKGRVIEIYGPESSGKTTVALHAISEVQRSGGIAAFVDAEHALDPTYAANLGVDIENLLVSQPDTGEMGLEIVDQLVRSTAVDIVVIDSVAALVPRAEIEGQMGESQIGLQARLMSHALRKITGNIGKSGCTVVFLNQLRQKNWRDLWESRSDHRRTSAEVLRFREIRYPPNSNLEKRFRRIWDSGKSESGEK
jgi:recombination protein RecA